MKISRQSCSCLTVLIVLLLSAPLSGRELKKKFKPREPADVEATVLSLRRYELGTYVEAMRDDGKYEWIEVPENVGMGLKADQRITYSTGHDAHWSESFGGMLRNGVDVRILPVKRDERIYRGTGPDGTIVFTDNPSTQDDARPLAANEDNPKKAVSKGDKNKSSTPNKKSAREQTADEVIIVDPEELAKKEAFMKECYRYMEETNTTRPERKAKRAKPRQN